MRDCAYQPLSKTQKMRLCRLAAEAFEHRALGGDLAAWRRDQALRACGRRISEAVMGDFLTLKAHFEDLAGRSGQAFETLMREHTNPRRIALHKLWDESAKAGFDPSYATAICRRQYKCEPREASAKQLWTLVYTIRNRAKKTRR